MSATNPDNSASPPPASDAAAPVDSTIESPSTAAGGEAPTAPPQNSPPPAGEGSVEAHADPVSSPVATLPLDLPDFSPRTAAPRNDQAIDLLNDVELNVKIELGRANMLIEDVLRLGQGSVVELDKLAGDPVDVLVNDRLVARGEVLVLNDNFCVRISEIVSGVEEEVVEAGAA